MSLALIIKQMHTTMYMYPRKVKCLAFLDITSSLRLAHSGASGSLIAEDKVQEIERDAGL